MMRYSDNGGKTNSNERRKDLGLIGEYETTVEYYRLGLFDAPGRIIQLSSSAAVVRGILGLSGDLRPATP